MIHDALYIHTYERLMEIPEEQLSEKEETMEAVFRTSLRFVTTLTLRTWL
jgi:hypothetical protein